MRTRSANHSDLSKKPVRVRPDPFDPVRRGARPAHGKRGPVLTRRERVVQREALRAANVSESRSLWDTVRIAQAWRDRDAPAACDALWQRPVNATGVVADAVLQLAAPMLHAHSQAYRTDLRDAHVVGSSQVKARVRDTGTGTGTGTGSVTGTGVRPAGASAPLAERAMAAWISQGCTAITQIGRVARGLGWSAMQAAVSRFALPDCRFSLTQAPAQADLELLSDGCVVNRLRTKPRPASDPRTRAPATVDADSPGAIGRREARFVSAWNTPLVQAAVNSVHLGFPDGERNAMTMAYARLTGKLDEFLQGPCGTLVRSVLESGQTNADLGAQLRASAVCDLLYQATPIGATGSVFGYLLELATKVRNREPMTAETVERGFGYLSIKPNIEGITQVGRRELLWTRAGLVDLEQSGTHEGVIREPGPSGAATRGVGVPVEHSPEGWRLKSIPVEYRVSADVTDLLDDPRALIRSAPANGYVKIDGAIYEAHHDARSTRWHIAPPDGEPGPRIAIEYDPVQARWEPLRLLGAGDTPPPAERYAARDAALRRGPEGDVYVDAHAQEYDTALLPDNVASMSYDQLVGMWVDDSQMAPRELGVLHQYIEMRRWDDLSERVRENVRAATATHEGTTAYLRGMHRGDATRLPGHSPGMSPLALLERAAHGNLDAFELGASTAELAERTVVTRVHQEVDRIFHSAVHSMLGALRWDRIRLPGVSDETSYEALLTMFLHSELTEVQRGALRPRIQSAAHEAYGDTVALSHRISSVRASGVPEVETAFTYGYQHYLDYPVDEQASLRSLVRSAMELADSPAELGALWRHIEILQSEIDALSDDFRLAIERIDHGLEPFRAGFDNAWGVELPPTDYGTAAELAQLFYRDSLSLVQQGALYGRLRERELMTEVDARVQAQRRAGHGARVDLGRANPDDYPVSGLPLDPALDEIVERLGRGDLQPEQVGRLSEMADRLAHTRLEERVELVRHQLVTGPRFNEYLDGFLNPEATADGDLPLQTLAAFNNEMLLDMFRHDATGPRARGRIAGRLTLLDAEQTQRDIVLIRRVYMNADAVRRVEFPQTEIPRMLHGMLDGSCFALSAVMSVAMNRGHVAIDVFVQRMRSAIRNADPLPGESVGRRVLGTEQGNVVAGLAALSVRQPGTPGELIADELVPFPEPVAWQDLHTLFGESAPDGGADYLILTNRHAMACRVEAAPGSVRGVLYHFYEPNYGLLTFNRLRALRVAIENAFTSPYYQHNVLGGSPLVDVYMVNPESLGSVAIRGHLTIDDLVDARPFRRSRLRVNPAPGTRVDAGTQTDPLDDEWDDDTPPDSPDAGSWPVFVDAGTQTDARGRGRPAV